LLEDVIFGFDVFLFLALVEASTGFPSPPPAKVWKAQLGTFLGGSGFACHGVRMEPTPCALESRWGTGGPVASSTSTIKTLAIYQVLYSSYI
jgi:hypothetical protein